MHNNNQSIISEINHNETISHNKDTIFCAKSPDNNSSFNKSESTQILNIGNLEKKDKIEIVNNIVKNINPSPVLRELNYFTDVNHFGRSKIDKGSESATKIVKDINPSSIAYEPIPFEIAGAVANHFRRR